MKYAMKTAGLALMLPLAVGSTAASAQIDKFGKKDAQEERKQAGATINLGDRKLVISAAAVAPIQELQTAVTAGDMAVIPAKLAAAKAAAKTPDERYIVAKLQLQAATASRNEAALIPAMEEVLATGLAPRQEVIALHHNIAKAHLDANRHQQAAAAFQRVVELDPGNAQAAAALAAIQGQQAAPTDAVAALQTAIAAARAGGAKPPESLYKRAIAVAHGAKMPNTLQLSRSWVEAYPTPANWREALQLYINTGLDDETTLDVLRLARAAGALSREADYQMYGFLSSGSAAPAEAAQVVQEGAAAGRIDADKKVFKDILAESRRKSAGQQERLPALVNDALASSNAKLAQNAGDILYSYGEYGRAAELYRAALGKSGADRNLLNLRLGMALARAGDMAAATVALNAVSGPRAEVAKYWLTYLQTRS